MLVHILRFLWRPFDCLWILELVFFASYLGSYGQNTGVYQETQFYDFSTIINAPLLGNATPPGALIRENTVGSLANEISQIR